ncbi:MAG: ABC transporter permease [Actinomycetales bacterium]
MPAALAVPALVGIGFLVLPLVAMVVMAPWRELPALLGQPRVLDALRLSLTTATAATIVALLCGVPLAWMLARLPGRRIGLLRALVTLPLVLPPVVGGVALLLAYGRVGLVGRWLYAATGWQIPFSTVAVIFAQTFVAMPFLVITVEGALRSAGTDLDEAAATLGAGRVSTFWQVTLPVLAPNVAAGAVLCWARALGEFGATVTFAGNLPGVTQTMPSAVYRAFETDPPAAVALSLVLLAVSVSVLVLLRGRWISGGAW